MKKSIWRSFKFGKGTCLRQDKRCVKGANRTAAQKRASSKRMKR